VSWFNKNRLTTPLGYVLPDEFEVIHHHGLEQQALPTRPTSTGLRENRRCFSMGLPQEHVFGFDRVPGWGAAACDGGHMFHRASERQPAQNRAVCIQRKG
jgi:hypothetical protein